VSSRSTTVVGGGISGIACARALVDAGRAVRVLDRGRRVGGRMASRTLHGRPVDLGASYFTVPDGSPFAAVVTDWQRRGLARPWTDTFAVAGPDGVTGTRPGPLRWGAPAGLRSLVVDLSTGLDVVAQRAVEAVRLDDAGRPTVDGAAVDAVVLALPDPQAQRLLAPEVAADLALEPASWQPVLAVALGFRQRVWPVDLHGVFVHDSPVLDWVADDGSRRGDGAPVLVAHTTAAFAGQHLAEPDGGVPVVGAGGRGLLRPGPAPDWAHVHRWSYAKPGSPRSRDFGLTGRIGVCGDGWSAPSRVASAWRSGDALGRQLA
jgi:predicted NAD/FAD-dependent oxidoreductase